MATDLIAHGRQHLLGKCMLLPGAETGEQGCQHVEPFLQGVRKSATQELVVNERLDE
jgi:hypothetical protein